MSKVKRSDKVKTIIMTATRKDFFARGKAIAKAIDEDKPLAEQRIISFEDTKDLVKFLTERKLNLVKMLRQKPDSVSHLAKRLKRSRAAVDKDIQLLESVGIVKCEYIINPGHGRNKIARVAEAGPIKLQVQAVI